MKQSQKQIKEQIIFIKGKYDAWSTIVHSGIAILDAYNKELASLEKQLKKPKGSKNESRTRRKQKAK